VHETVRRLIGAMVDDVIGESQARLSRTGGQSVEDIRALPHPVIAFSDAMTLAQKTLKQFLHQQMYRHPRVNRMTEKAARVVSDLFGLYTAQPEQLPAARGAGMPDTPRRVADFIAGMTDRFALEEHRRHFEQNC
jgi:dGTPase